MCVPAAVAVRLRVHPAFRRAEWVWHECRPRRRRWRGCKRRREMGTSTV